MKFVKVFSLALFALFAFNIQAQDLQEVTPKEAVVMVNKGALILDVRENHEVETLAYKADNVMHIPLSQLESRIKEVPMDKNLVMACRSGRRSVRAAGILADNGYKNMVNLKGGIIAWQDNGFEVAKGYASADAAAAPKAACTGAPKGASCASSKKSCASADKAAKSCTAEQKTEKSCTADKAPKSCASAAGKKSCCASKAKATKAN